MKLCGIFFGLLCCAAWAQKPAAKPSATLPPPAPGGAMEAVRLLPKESASRLARIEAREGHPKPDRWYVLVYEPENPLGLREFVIADGKIAAARQLSQFADRLTEADAFGDAFLRVDSGYCARLAELYAAANNVTPAFLQYELARPIVPPGSPPAKAEATWPLWRLTVLDAKGDQVGTLAISAARGTVLSHDGFDKVPETSSLPPLPTPPPASLSAPKPVPKPVKPKPGTPSKPDDKKKKPR